ncbi:uncharacterized protein [Sinocyclocheilus grahami]|uniref:uncharacterized protein n=1 Tax=Sinocyclocheilus grahami TaxID=75366 RepID=UPI0007AD51CD|nr:PREDICTED: uncharacterized protein LOC107550344 [Sinocyclocheilus grahami]
MHSQQVKTCRLCMSPEHMVKDCPEFRCYKCDERGHFARDCKAVKCPDCEEVLNKCECWMENEEEEEEGVSGQMDEGDSEKGQEDGTMTTQVNGTKENKDKGEQSEESNIQKEQAQQGGEADMQMDILQTVEKILDRIEHQRIVNEEQTVEMGSEEEKEDKVGKQMKRRRSIKVKPSLAGARKKVVKEDSLKNVNRYELLKDLGEIE